MKGFLLFLFGSLCGAIAMFLVMASQRDAAPIERSAARSPAAETTAITTMPSFPARLPAAATQAQTTASTARWELTIAPRTDTTENNSNMVSSANAPEPASLMVPVDGVQPIQLTDTFDDARAAGRVHDAIDIMAPKGTRVLAAADGKVAKLFTSVRGGLTVYEIDPTQTYCYYYAHLDSYAPGMNEGKQLTRGDLIGFVGSSGDANPAAPHLHFEITLLGPEKHWWQGKSINPYPILTGRQSLAAAASVPMSP